MHGIVETIDSWGAQWAALVVVMVWQSTLVALLVAAAAYALAGSSPAVRYWLWQLVAIKLLVLPLWSLPLAPDWLTSSMPSASRVEQPEAGRLRTAADGRPVDDGRTEVVINVAGSDEPLAARPRWPLGRLSWRGWLFIGWGLLVLVQIGRLAIQRLRLARLLRRTVPGDQRLVAVVDRMATLMDLNNVPRIVTTDRACSPFVCGMVRPTLVLPRELADALDEAQLEQVVAHELAHVKRRDLVWGWIPQIARLLYFFHPVAHWADYRIRLERELASDQMAMIALRRPAAEYADTLVRVLSAASRPGIFSTSVAASFDGSAAARPE